MSDYFELLKKDKQYLNLLSESIQTTKTKDQPFSSKSFAEQIKEMKSSTKAGWAGAGLGVAANIALRQGRPGVGAATIAGGAIAANQIKKKRMRDQCTKKYPDNGTDQDKCFRFRNQFGRMPADKGELTAGRPKYK